MPSIPFAEAPFGRGSSGWLPMPPFGRSVKGGLFVEAGRLYALGLAGTSGFGGGGGGGLAFPAAALGFGVRSLP